MGKWKEIFHYFNGGKEHVVIVKKDPNGNDIWWKNKPLQEGFVSGLHIINRPDLPAHMDFYDNQKEMQVKEPLLRIQTGTATFHSGTNIFNKDGEKDLFIFPISNVDVFNVEQCSKVVTISVGTCGILAYACMEGSLVKQE